MKIQQKNILIAPLNWGLGHATRCIPIIKALENNNFTPIIASDGGALQFLKLEFPHLQFLELPSYKIVYPKNGKNFRWKMLQNIPNIILAVAKERKLIQKWTSEYALLGIISDNRLGVFSKRLPSVFITHQLSVLTGFTTFFSTKMHQQFSRKFSEVWIPDFKEAPNLSGKLGHLRTENSKIKHIGPLSRFRKIDAEPRYDLMVLLSGPEPQRTILEGKLISEVKKYAGTVIFIKGIIEEKQQIHQEENILFYNFMQSDELQQAFSESEIVLCRSGYTTIMDLSVLQKKAFFIPTPGQFEQEYLAEKFQIEGNVPFCEQEDFSIERLTEMENFRGFQFKKTEVDWNELFSQFNSK